MRTTLKLSSLLLTGLLLVACEQDGPAERAGEAIDDAADEIGDAGDDFGDAIEDACEEVKDGVDAEDQDC
ncbi:MAG: hypothetical protein HKN35_06175 [Woeseia sp.]|nr:hypothetical protein [Woeseia sp.]